MKKAIFALFAGFAVMVSAFATPLPEIVVNTTGTVVYGIGTAISIKKDTSNRVAVQYINGGTQYVQDDASWTKYGKLVTALGSHGMAVGDAAGTVVNVADSNGVYCSSGSSTISYPSGASPIVISGDGCAFWQAVKAVAN